MLQIQFLDKNVVNALVPAFSMQPSKITFFYDRRYVSEKNVKNIDIAVKAKMKDVKIEFIQTDMFSIHDIKDHLKECIEENKEERVCIDVTGGPELMTASGLLMYKADKVQVVYTNLSKGYIFDVVTEEKVADVKHISADDYLAAIGAKHFKRSHSLPSENEYDMICQMAEYIFENLGEWHALHKYLSDKYAYNNSLDFKLPERINYNGHSYNSSDALEQFIKNGLVIVENNKYRFANIKYKEYMMEHGVWLEMYIYIKGKEFFDETHLGYIIDWDNSDAKDTVDNEIDVLVLRKSIPIFISCKMRKPNSTDLCEVAYLADRLGGSSAKGIVATTYNVSDDKNLAEGIFKRLKKMNVGFIETESFKTHTASQVFNTVMQGAE